MEDHTIRLNKYLANAGVCARRDVKQLLKDKTVTVNGERATEPGVRIDPRKDVIAIDGKKMTAPTLVYYLLNKPKGVVSTTADEFGRKNVTKLVPSEQRVYPVGRLDKDTTGLIILTNDGELTNLLTHPRYHVDKIYRLTINGRLDKFQLKALRDGVLLDDGITYPAQVTIIKESNENSIVEMKIHEGRNRQIRRMCETVDADLVALQRVQFGPIAINGLKEGAYRELTKKEIEVLQKTAKKV